jgi:hypothetical protein
MTDTSTPGRMEQGVTPLPATFSLMRSAATELACLDQGPLVTKLIVEKAGENLRLSHTGQSLKVDI